MKQSDGESPPLRIAIVVEHLAPDVCDSTASVGPLAQALAERGHQVTLIAGACREPAAWPEVEVRALRKGGRDGWVHLLGFAGWARYQLRQRNVDVVLALTSLVPGDVLQPADGLVHQRQRGAGTGVKSRLAPGWHALRLLESGVLRAKRLRKVVSISRYMTDALANDVGSDRISFLPPAVETMSASQQQRQTWRTRIRRAFNMTQEACVFLVSQPGSSAFELLVEAVGRLRQRGNEAFLLVSGPVTYSLQREAARRGLRSAVRFAGTARHRAPLFSAADVTVNLTLHQPASRVVLESLRAKTPVITTRFDGGGEFVVPQNHEPRGIVLDDPRDAAEVQRAMSRLVDPHLREPYQAACYQLEQTLSLERHVDAMEALLRGVARQEVEPSSSRSANG
jgi:glycosyltransferase involved in cell wall biosynthesis